MDLASLRAQQIELASSVIREDRLDKDPPQYIGGADVGFEQGGDVTRAAMVVVGRRFFLHRYAFNFALPQGGGRDGIAQCKINRISEF